MLFRSSLLGAGSMFTSIVPLLVPVSIKVPSTSAKKIRNSLTPAALVIGDWGLSAVQEFTDDVQKSAILEANQVALAITGTVVSVLAAFIPMLNFEKIGANVGAAEAKVGSLTGGKGSEVSIPKDPNAPEGDINPPTDPAPPEGSDVDQFFSAAQQQEAEGIEQPATLQPGENWAIDFAYVEGHPLRNPILIPPAEDEAEETLSLTPDIGRREAQVLLGTIPVDIAYQGGVWEDFIGNVTLQMQMQLDLFTTAIMTDPTMTDVLLSDLAARAINNVWNSYYAYVSFTNLGDLPYGNSTPACNAHTAGPQITKFCGVGGVFYLYMLSQGDEDQGVWQPTGEDSTPNDESTASYPGQITPYGLSNFQTNAFINITASGPTEGSARAWNATGETNITATQSIDMMNNIGVLFNEADVSDLFSVVGRLPGEWSIPVCNQGTNSWGADYTKSTVGYNIGYLPCACGYQGNETANFMQAIGISDSDLYNLAFYCCEGSLLFPDIKHSQVNVTDNTGPGASGLDGGVWADDAPLYYGMITAQDIHNKALHCSSKGVLTPAPNTN
ncbi:hypothetical protein P7C71_g6220, partial [Lecanoromycetidae sp. Uapishka_2]